MFSDVANQDLGNVTTFGAAGVSTGTYYVRMRAKHRCGRSSVSNEVELIVR